MRGRGLENGRTVADLCPCGHCRISEIAFGCWTKSPSEVQKRIDPSNGFGYTRVEFEAYYGGLDQWNAAYVAESAGRRFALSNRIRMAVASQPILYAGPDESFSSAKISSRLFIWHV